MDGLILLGLGCVRGEVCSGAGMTNKLLRTSVGTKNISEQSTSPKTEFLMKQTYRWQLVQIRNECFIYSLGRLVVLSVSTFWPEGGLILSVSMPPCLPVLWWREGSSAAGGGEANHNIGLILLRIIGIACSGAAAQ